MAQERTAKDFSSRNDLKVEGDFTTQLSPGQQPKDVLYDEINKLRQLGEHRSASTKQDTRQKNAQRQTDSPSNGPYINQFDLDTSALKRAGRWEPAPTTPESPEPINSIKAAVERAKNGGRPFTLTQIGDSHIAFGMETPSIAAHLAADLGLKPDQIRFSSFGEVGKTASYAKDRPDEFMKNVTKDTDLTIVSFGSNEATTTQGKQYESDYKTLVDQIRTRDQGGAIAMVGPTDGNFWNSQKHLPGLQSVTEAQKHIAEHVPNSSYIEIAPEMGSVETMRADGLMSQDNLHLTSSGYEKLGASIAQDIASHSK